MQLKLRCTPSSLKYVKLRLLGEKLHAEGSEAGKFFNLNYENSPIKG